VSLQSGQTWLGGEEGNTSLDERSGDTTGPHKRVKIGHTGCDGVATAALIRHVDAALFRYHWTMADREVGVE
jgi:hypothetical protein